MGTLRAFILDQLKQLQVPPNQSELMKESTKLDSSLDLCGRVEQTHPETEATTFSSQADLL